MAQAEKRLTPRQERAAYRTRIAISDLEQGQLPAARAKLEEALDLDHELVEARLWLAHVLLQQGEPEPAQQQYETGLLFAPNDPRLLDGIRAAQAAAKTASAPAGRDKRIAKQRLIPNIIMAALFPPSGIIMGLWEIVTGSTKEWKDLGLKTLLAGVTASFVWGVIYMFLIAITAGGMVE